MKNVVTARPREQGRTSSGGFDAENGGRVDDIDHLQTHGVVDGRGRALLAGEPAAIAVTLIGPRPYAAGTLTTSPTATLISQVPSAHGPVGAGEGVDDRAGVCMGSDAGPDPFGRPLSSAGDPSEELEEHPVRTATRQAATVATAAVDDGH
ncbi:hypothetical protein [Streptomyces sviceus]|uniref:hypothetical protein n=1 Tax=Streptomyces sviceus TaxID=285530 RepID=UPI0036E12508